MAILGKNISENLFKNLLEFNIGGSDPAAPIQTFQNLAATLGESDADVETLITDLRNIALSQGFEQTRDSTVETIYQEQVVPFEQSSQWIWGPHVNANQVPNETSAYYQNPEYKTVKSDNVIYGDPYLTQPLLTVKDLIGKNEGALQLTDDFKNVVQNFKGIESSEEIARKQQKQKVAKNLITDRRAELKTDTAKAASPTIDLSAFKRPTLLGS